MVPRILLTKTEFLQRVSCKTGRKRSALNELKQKTGGGYSKIKIADVFQFVSPQPFVHDGMVLFRS